MVCLLCLRKDRVFKDVYNHDEECNFLVIVYSVEFICRISDIKRGKVVEVLQEIRIDLKSFVGETERRERHGKRDAKGVTCCGFRFIFPMQGGCFCKS